MIYHYFKSKDELFRAVLENTYAEIRSPNRSSTSTGSSPEPR